MGGERQDALKARLYPASMPAGVERGGVSSIFPFMEITLVQVTTRHSGFHGLIKCFTWYGLDKKRQLEDCEYLYYIVRQHFAYCQTGASVD